MKEITTLLTTFLVCAAQFVIGACIVAGSANIKTIGWYYLVSSSFTILVAVLGVIGLAVRGGMK